MAAGGDALSLLAVAVAEPSTLSRTGWGVAEQTARADTQGWTTASVTVLASPPDDAAPAADEASGCGCEAAPGVAPMSLWVLLARR